MTRPPGKLKRGPKAGKGASKSRSIAKRHINFTQEDEQLFKEAYKSEGLGPTAFLRSRIHGYAAGQELKGVQASIEAKLAEFTAVVSTARKASPEVQTDTVDFDAAMADITAYGALLDRIGDWLLLMTLIERVLTEFDVHPEIEFGAETKAALDGNYTGEWKRFIDKGAPLTRSPIRLLHFVEDFGKFVKLFAVTAPTATTAVNIFPAWVTRSFVFFDACEIIMSTIKDAAAAQSELSKPSPLSALWRLLKQ
jgi:hypothetical protein